MDIYETAVLDYCCAPPGRFVSPQFHIARDAGTGGSQPDFVVLDFRRSTVYVVEVTSSSTSKTILARVAERESRWLKPLRATLTDMHKPLGEWPFHVTLFVREEICSSVTAKLEDVDGVSVISLDRVMFPWRWKWLSSDVPENPLE